MVGAGRTSLLVQPEIRKVRRVLDDVPMHRPVLRPSCLNLPLGVQKAGTRHRFKCAEYPELARDHVKIGRTLRARVESDVLGMLDGDPIPVFETENEGTERSLRDECWTSARTAAVSIAILSRM